ncbi:MAG: sugar phosphate isomerase/epimerase [Ekhidna sp.]|nr:sugar phosphate isomerase/epimerase [Ekhidna sp.]
MATTLPSISIIGSAGIQAKKSPFKISLAQWSLHRMLKKGDLANLDFPAFTKETFDIDAVEYVNQFFKDKAKDKAYLNDLLNRTKSEGVKNLIIMVDGEGKLGEQNQSDRKKAVENHYKWVEAAKHLGCHSIRVNAGGKGSREEVATAVVDSLSELSTFAKDYKINVIVENHGGYSSDGGWLSDVIEKVNLNNCGTLPDFGNFTINRKENLKYDRYKGMTELAPLAKAVSAKCYNFDTSGKETTIDFGKMMQIVKQSNYKGYVGIEYEGKEMSEVEAIKAAKKLLEKTFASI